MLQIDTWKRVLIWLVCVAGLLAALPNAFYTRVEQSNDAWAQIEVEGETPERLTVAEQWPEWMPSGLVNLGLDLRGGAHLLAEVQVSDVYTARMDALWPEVRNVLRDERGTIGTFRRIPEAPADQIRLRLSDAAGMSRALELVRGLANPVTSLTGAGATDITVSGQGDVITIALSDEEKLASDDRTVRQSLEIIRRRIDEVGTREPTIQRQGSDRILIQVPGIGSAAELKEIIGTTAQLTFNPVVSRGSDADASAGIGNKVIPSIDEPGTYYTVESAPVVTGEELVDAQPAFDQNGQPAVNFRFNTAGARKFGDYTAQNIGAPFAIVLDDEVISAPVIRSHIPGGSGIITGNFSVEDSTQLAVLLRAGALPAELQFLEERTIGPELGQDSIDAGKVATVVAFAAVLVFMVLSYGLFGFFANIALILNIALIFGALSLIGGTLTLPGIAGIVLTVGMAVDANVLIFARIREEMANGVTPHAAINAGYDRAFLTILDANITTLLVGLVLFAFGSGPVKGFAVTLSIGILTSMFTAIVGTRAIVNLIYGGRALKKLSI